MDFWNRDDSRLPNVGPSLSEALYMAASGSAINWGKIPQYPVREEVWARGLVNIYIGE